MFVGLVPQLTFLDQLDNFPRMTVLLTLAFSVRSLQARLGADGSVCQQEGQHRQGGPTHQRSSQWWG